MVPPKRNAGTAFECDGRYVVRIWPDVLIAIGLAALFVFGVAMSIGVFGNCKMSKGINPNGLNRGAIDRVVTGCQ